MDKTLLNLINSMQNPREKTRSKKDEGTVVPALRQQAADMATSLTILPRQVMGQQISQEELDRAKSGSEAFFGGMSPAGPVITAPAVAKTGASVALPEIKNAGEKVIKESTKAVDDAMAGAQTQQGGLQAGFMKMGGEKPTQVRITLKPSVYGAGREKAVQETVDTVVPGRTATDKYSNLETTMDDLGQKINEVMVRNPKVASLDQVMKDYDTNLAREGIYRTTNAPKSTVQKAARDYVTKLYTSAKGMPDNIAPAEVADVDLYRLKQMVNADAQSIFKKIDNGTTVTDKEKVILAARQTIDDALSTLHPEVKEFTTKQSHLYDAADVLKKARDAELNVAPEPNLLQRMGTVGATGALAAVGGVGALAGNLLPKIGGLSTGSGQNDTDSFAVDPNAKPKYEVNTPLEDGTLMSEETYGKQQADLRKQLGQIKLTDPIQAAALEQQIAANEELFNSQGNLRKIATDSRVVFDSANKLTQSLEASPNAEWMNFVSKGYDEMAKASGGEYARLAADLKALEEASGVQIFGSTPRSKEAFAQGIDGLVELQKTKMGAQRQQFQGSGTQPAAAPAQSALPEIPQEPVNWQQKDPRVEAVMGGLPPIR